MTAPLRWMPAKAHGGPFRPPAACFVVWHCTESDNQPGTAESLAGPNWFGGPAGTSAHTMFDQDSGVEMVHEDLVAYHAGPGGNTFGWSIEICGRAGWSAAKWREPAQLAAINRAAKRAAQALVKIAGGRQEAIYVCRWLSIAQVAGRKYGMCTHNDIRLALGGTTHSDPGPNFPYAEALAYTLAALEGTPATTPAVPAALPAGDDMIDTGLTPDGTVWLLSALDVTATANPGLAATALKTTGKTTHTRYTHEEMTELRNDAQARAARLAAILKA